MCDRCGTPGPGLRGDPITPSQAGLGATPGRTLAGLREWGTAHRERGRPVGSVLRRPRLGEGRRRLAEPLGRCPAAGLGLSTALKIATEPGSWENIGTQHGQLP